MQNESILEECVPGSAKPFSISSRQQVFLLARSAPNEKKLKTGGHLGGSSISLVESKDGESLIGAMVIVM